LFTINELDTGATIVPKIRPDWYANRCGALIPAYPLDHLAKQLALSDRFFFKIDVEGGELAVLKGAIETIKRHQPIIQCEVLHAHRNSERLINDETKQTILNLLKELNYVPFLCVLQRDDHQKLLGLERIQSFPSAVWADEPHICDYVFAPGSLEGLISSFYNNARKANTKQSLLNYKPDRTSKKVITRIP
jgi:hypothetical protein